MKKTSLVKMSDEKIPDFLEIIKKRYIEKYADEALKLYEDAKKIERAHIKFQNWLEELEAGNILVLEDYKKERRSLENRDGYEL